jgi:hypothetical protein
MISDVIVQEMYDRTFLLLTAIFMFGVQQVNLRAYYKQLYGKISKKSIKQASRGLINNSLNDDDQTLSSVEHLDVQIDMSALDPDKNPEGYE